jgi:transposase-like protein
LYTAHSERGRKDVYDPGNSDMKCPQCQAEDVIEIKNRIDDIEIDFFSCHRCEEKWWDKSGEPVSLHEVLEIVRKSRA